jgi:hypothetical protein
MCGTSALHDYLDLHPQVNISQPKEVSFFLQVVGGQMGWNGTSHIGRRLT